MCNSSEAGGIDILGSQDMLDAQSISLQHRDRPSKRRTLKDFNKMPAISSPNSALKDYTGIESSQSNRQPAKDTASSFLKSDDFESNSDKGRRKAKKEIATVSQTHEIEANSMRGLR